MCFTSAMADAHPLALRDVTTLQTPEPRDRLGPVQQLVTEGSE